MYFPRIMALSELAWCPADRKDFSNFTQRLPHHFRMLQQLGIPYRTPAPEGFYRFNAFTTVGTLNATCADPAAQIRYTTDGTIPTIDSPLYEGPLSVSETTTFALRTFLSNGHAGETIHTDFVKQGFLEPVRSQLSTVNSHRHLVRHPRLQVRQHPPEPRPPDLRRR